MSSAIGSVVGGLAGGSTPSSPNLQTWQPTGTAAFDTNYQNLIGQLVASNPYQTYAPEATATFNAAYNNPTASGYQTAANTAGQQYGAAGTAATGSAPALTTAGNTALAGANQVLNMGFDPQSQLYQRTLQQLNDQVNANGAQRGITNSPYGASVANNANENFNIDWQNNQLTKAIQALSGYTSGVSGANADFTGANTLATAGASDTAKAGAVPFAASTDITNSQDAALTQLLAVLGNSGSSAYTSNILSQLMPYLNLAAGQANTQANLDQTSYLDAVKSAASSQAGLGSLVSGGLNAAGQVASANPSSVASLIALLA